MAWMAQSGHAGLFRTFFATLSSSQARAGHETLASRSIVGPAGRGGAEPGSGPSGSAGKAASGGPGLGFCPPLKSACLEQRNTSRPCQRQKDERK